eukprot:3946841-Prymnesium_polylepis.1
MEQNGTLSPAFPTHPSAPVKNDIISWISAPSCLPALVPSRRPRTTRSALSAPVNLQLLRCEHDETDRVAPSGALLWTRGWHPMPVMLHGARKADSPPKFKKASPSLTFAQGSNGTPHATSPRGSQPAPDTRM